MTTTFDIERRLRLPAPDEPAVLPALVLPTDTASIGRAGIRWRLIEPQSIRLAYALLALMLLLAAVIAVGALRQRQSNLTPLGLVCQPDQGPLIGTYCASVAIPDGWTTLASGQIMPGDVTEVDLGDEIVDLVIASVPLGNCPTTGPFPTAFPLGSNAFQQPDPTPDAGLACLRDAPLPENAVRVETLKGSRIHGLDDNGFGVPDTSEPTVEAGWKETVAGRPAKLLVTAGSGAPGEAAETRTWDVLMPGSIDRVVRLRADIAGPDVGRGRATVQSMVDSLSFSTTVPELREADANHVLRTVLDALDRSTREQHSDFYGCFPREPGTTGGTISGDPSGPLSGALDVTCSSTISASRAGVWRIVLDVSWEATEDFAGDTIRTELFATGVMVDARNPEFSGGYTTSLAGRSMQEIGVSSWFPTGSHALPPALAGPLNLPPGSLVKMLPPGEGPVPVAGGADDSIYPAIVGTHLYVLAGPEVIEGEEWYQVQSGSDSFQEVGWIRGTRDGRPQLEIVAPTCPGAGASVGDVTWLIASERLICFGDRELTFVPAVLQRNDQGLVMCSDVYGEVHPCAGGEPDWLTAFTVWQLYDAEGPSGPNPPLAVWFQPSLGAPPEGELVRIVGQFDHPEAAGCRWPEDGSAGPIVGDPAIEELFCRQRFVVTSFEPVDNH